MEKMIELMQDQISVQIGVAELMSASVNQNNLSNYIHSLQAEVTAINAILQNKSVTGDREMDLYNRLFELQSILRKINDSSLDVLGGGEDKEEETTKK